ncbi:hypothetical protein HPNQ4099_0746 [Helicobacter pylori NQ4099]|uniref:Uncharacterized protein n=2 Tax=Helicobacter pylori TaxID=210 RepID=I9Z3D8_HELPX|nr:hypothetical protein HPNQ4099_0746 [Helicobacter pylori NQ4099]EJB34382.1 hypothetical protein HPNQ4076_0630 [Helicobacter pylori NQ4076]
MILSSGIFKSGLMDLGGILVIGENYFKIPLISLRKWV